MNKGPRNKNKERHVVLNKILCYMLIKIAIPSFLRLKMGTSFKIENDLQPYMLIRKNGTMSTLRQYNISNRWLASR